MTSGRKGTTQGHTQRYYSTEKLPMRTVFVLILLASCIPAPTTAQDAAPSPPNLPQDTKKAADAIRQKAAAKGSQLPAAKKKSNSYDSMLKDFEKRLGDSEKAYEEYTEKQDEKWEKLEEKLEKQGEKLEEKWEKQEEKWDEQGDENSSFSKALKKAVVSGTSNTKSMKIVGRVHLDYWGIPSSDAGINTIESGDPNTTCLLYTSPSPRDATLSRMPSSA